MLDGKSFLSPEISVSKTQCLGSLHFAGMVMLSLELILPCMLVYILICIYISLCVSLFYVFITFAIDLLYVSFPPFPFLLVCLLVCILHLYYCKYIYIFPTISSPHIYKYFQKYTSPSRMDLSSY